MGEGDGAELQCETDLVVSTLLPSILQVAQDEKSQPTQQDDSGLWDIKNLFHREYSQ